MKKFISFFVFSLCFIFGLHAQLNEVALSYQTLKAQEFGTGLSFSYYRNISARSAMGLRVNTNGFFRKEDFNNTNVVSIDLVNRWSLTKSKKFRILAELGASVLQRYDETPIILTDVFIRPFRSFPQIDESIDWYKTTYYGLVSSIGFDVAISKRLMFGMDLSKSFYYTEQLSFFDKKISPMNLRIRIGARF